MAATSKAAPALLLCASLLLCRVLGTHTAPPYPQISMRFNLGALKLENEVYDEDGDTITDLALDADQMTINQPSLLDELYLLYYSPEARDEVFDTADGTLVARKHLYSLMAKRLGGDSSEEDAPESISKRHSDGIFTDSYSRYRKQMAVKKYLSAVLGSRYRQRVRNKGRRYAYL